MELSQLRMFKTVYELGSIARTLADRRARQAELLGLIRQLQASPAGRTAGDGPAPRAAAQAHVCRTVARRAERQVVALGNEESINETPRQYLNRLSDLLFVLARVLNRVNGGDDVYWKSERLQQAGQA